MFLVRNTPTVMEDSTGDSAEKTRQETREILINKSLQSNQLAEQSEKNSWKDCSRSNCKTL